MSPQGRARRSRASHASACELRFDFTCAAWQPNGVPSQGRHQHPLIACPKPFSEPSGRVATVLPGPYPQPRRDILRQFDGEAVHCAKSESHDVRVNCELAVTAASRLESPYRWGCRSRRWPGAEHSTRVPEQRLNVCCPAPRRATAVDDSIVR